jgi:hypothetical protein
LLASSTQQQRDGIERRTKREKTKKSQTRELEKQKKFVSMFFQGSQPKTGCMSLNSTARD